MSYDKCNIIMGNKDLGIMHCIRKRTDAFMIFWLLWCSMIYPA